VSPLAPFFAGNPAAFAAVAGLFGLVIGSFLNVVILRLPVMLDRRWRRQAHEVIGTNVAVTEERFDLVSPGSRCSHCGHAIRAWENIPVLSFLWLRGRCSACHASISRRYPAIELLSGLLTAAVALRFGFGLPALAAMVLTWTLIAAAFIDYDHQILPDDITLPLLWAGLLVNVSGMFAPLSQSVVGAVAGYLTLWAVYHVYRLLTRKEGMGYGDFKLLAAFGAWLGWVQLPLIILLSSFVGAVIGLFFILARGRDRSVPIPFGPFLCVAGWIALCWGERVTYAYLQFARLN
jgi:leader peptidase (prepilin peptidase) / N-methyltransferase